MTDPPGVPSALGIEAAEWFSEGGENLTVRLTGRWRRRRPAWSGQPQLVVEVQGTRHRFPAMPEPPSLSGTSPGTWRMSFSVPPWIAPHLGGRIWLQLGAAAVPLPVTIEPAAGEEAAPPPAPAELAEVPAAAEEQEPKPIAETIAEQRLRRAELDLDSARQRALDAERAAATLTAKVQQLDVELRETRATVTERERAVRSAEQRTYAEQALRVELEQQLASREQAEVVAGALEDLAQAEDRIRELEAELEDLRRTAVEAEQLAAAAQAARERAERRVRDPRWDVIGAELGVLTRSGPAPAPAQSGRLGAPGLAGERAMVAGRAAAGQRPQPVDPELESTLAELHAEFAKLRAEAERERARRIEAEHRAAELSRELDHQAARTARVYEAIGELRARVEMLRGQHAGAVAATPEPPAGPTEAAAPAEPAGQVAPERLTEALTRLREATASQPEQVAVVPTTPSASVKPWLLDVFKELLRHDATSAGRLLLGLLPAQSLVHPRPVAYDLVLSDVACVRVTVANGVSRVEFADAPRPADEVQFTVTGDLAGLARLVGGGRVRRRFGRRKAKVRGRRDEFGALLGLVQLRRGLGELHRAGVRLDPMLAFRVVSLMVDQALTAGERFTIAHREPEAASPDAFLHVRDREPLSVSEMPLFGPAATTVACPSDSLLLVLAGERPENLTLDGDEQPLSRLQRWVEVAQSGGTV